MGKCRERIVLCLLYVLIASSSNKSSLQDVLAHCAEYRNASSEEIVFVD